MRARQAGTAAAAASPSLLSVVSVPSFRYRKAVSERLNSRAMVWRVSVGGSWPAGMKTRARGLPWNLVWVCLGSWSGQSIGYVLRWFFHALATLWLFWVSFAVV
jgi:hypothetical protein